MNYLTSGVLLSELSATVCNSYHAAEKLSERSPTSNYKIEQLDGDPETFADDGKFIVKVLDDYDEILGYL